MTQPNQDVKILPVRSLMVDRSVQRAFTDRNRVAHIVEKFCRDDLGAIQVSARPDGMYHIIDGAHRVEAVQTVEGDDAEVLCLVWHELSRVEEAAKFLRLNHTRNVTSIDKFRVRVEANDPMAVRLNNVLVDNGWTVRSGASSGSFSAVDALMKVCEPAKTGGDDFLWACDAVIKIVTEAWGYNISGVRKEIVTGLGFLLRRYPEIDKVKIVHELAQYPGGPRNFVGQVKQLHDIRGGTVANCVSEKVVSLYNKGRRSRKIQWREDSAT